MGDSIIMEINTNVRSFYPVKYIESNSQIKSRKKINDGENETVKKSRSITLCF